MRLINLNVTQCVFKERKSFLDQNMKSKRFNSYVKLQLVSGTKKTRQMFKTIFF